MKKDYLPVTEGETASPEKDFVDQHWTRIWNEGQGNGAWNRDIESREEWHLVSPFLARLPAGARILDGGCGTGTWTLQLRSRGFDVTGLDISGATIARLRATFPGAPFQQGDIRCMPFADSSFDAYLSWGTFEHFEAGLGPCFEEAYRLLKPGGHLFVSVPYHNERLWLRDKRALHRTDADYDLARGYRSPQRFYQWRLTKQELRREFERHRFKVIQVNAIHKAAGIHRLLVSDLHVATDSKAHYVLGKALALLLPKSWVAHMLLAVGVKRV